jgi:hypothetical protein
MSLIGKHNAYRPAMRNNQMQTEINKQQMSEQTRNRLQIRSMPTVSAPTASAKE